MSVSSASSFVEVDSDRSEKLQAQNTAERGVLQEPIAIVGLGEFDRYHSPHDN